MLPILGSRCGGCMAVCCSVCLPKRARMHAASYWNCNEVGLDSQLRSYLTTQMAGMRDANRAARQAGAARPRPCLTPPPAGPPREVRIPPCGPARRKQGCEMQASVRQPGRFPPVAAFGPASASGAAPGTAGLVAPEFWTNAGGGGGKQGTYTLSKGNDRPPCSAFGGHEGCQPSGEAGRRRASTALLDPQGRLVKSGYRPAARQIVSKGVGCKCTAARSLPTRGGVRPG
jgi:hypothetical protein